MDEKIIGAGIIAGTIIIANGLINSEAVARPLVGVFVATFLLSGMSAAGAPQVASGLAVLTAGTVVVIYGSKILQEFNKL